MAVYPLSAVEVVVEPDFIGGVSWLPEVAAGYVKSFVDPSSRYDIMSYDVPDAVSTYTFAGAYNYLEKNLPLSAKPKLLKATALPAESLYFSGRINATSGAVSLEVPESVCATPNTMSLSPTSTLSSGDYILELETDKGRYRYPLQLQKLIVEHRDDALSSFELTVSPVDSIRRMRVFRGDTLLLDQAVPKS